MGEGKICLKLLVDRNANRVIFGEAGKDFVDFLFQFLSLPVGTVVKLLSKNKMVGSLGKIYESIENMQASYMEPNVIKDDVLNPKVYSSLGDTPLLLGNEGNADQLHETKFFYRCGSGCGYIASDLKTKCTSCGRIMTYQMNYVKSAENKEAGKISKSGYVKDLVTYMIMDDLTVKPMSNISGITLLSTFKVKDLSALESVEVYIGEKEAVDLLMASFVTKKVLTSLFLGNLKA
ncbi:hypothetical protein DCAR_0415576 [Daucus carota subsp. sativus]|uniref:Uncharacterized protein n=1 Tax=Daucus carota subsp. sativus TaxID=79200 RepID=A0A165WGN0_DAUCS|nr:PREDICTED: uncharacterized protein LOC108217194 [Daucus carota subsp. sativus]WOG96242.1 hypothetical protein DCAR_0415576 [Daucus carota subsp. sativus]